MKRLGAECGFYNLALCKKVLPQAILNAYIFPLGVDPTFLEQNVELNKKSGSQNHLWQNFFTRAHVFSHLLREETK